MLSRPYRRSTSHSLRNLLSAPDYSQQSRKRSLTRRVHVDAVDRLAILADINRLDLETSKLKPLPVPGVLCGRSPDSVSSNAENATHFQDLKVQLGAEVLERCLRRCVLVESIRANRGEGAVFGNRVEPCLSASHGSGTHSPWSPLQ